jgi:hypothetical protein
MVSTDLPLPYNGILGCPALAKFMAASHYAYNTLKMPGTMGVISVPSDKKDTIICMDKMYRDVVTAEVAEATVPAKEKRSRGTSKESGRCTTVECAAPVDDTPESSNSKRSKATPPLVKKVAAGLSGTDGTFTIGTTLDDK